MRTSRRYHAPLVALLALASCHARRDDDARLWDPTRPEARALAYLAEEVPRWPRENGCFSCHNNGDAARALLAARARGLRAHDDALASTLAWLRAPEAWDDAPGDERFQDRRLATLQFAAALAAADDAGFDVPRASIAAAARAIAAEQHDDGSWRVEPEGSVGSPISWGAIRTTHVARTLLRRAALPETERAAQRAGAWLAGRAARSVVEAASLVLALEGQEDRESIAARKSALAVIASGAHRDGGWGPFATSPREVFDTALVLLALAPRAETPEWKDLLRRGRAFLVATQEPAGGWPETTRPAGGTSYAQHISTSAWATLALLATCDLDPAALSVRAEP